MHCPFCSPWTLEVIDSRLVGEEFIIRRRQQCLVCNERSPRWQELVIPACCKSNDVREPFNEVRSGMLRALKSVSD